MAESLRDQLLKSGLAKSVPKASTRAGGKPRKPKRGESKQAGVSRSDQELDLARAYALRARSDSEQRKRAQRDAEQQARAKKERRRKLQALLTGKHLGKDTGELVRHFEYRGKIRRMHVDAEQLAAINTGKLGVVQFSGRYLLVDADIITQTAAIDPDAVALCVNPNDPASTDNDGIPDDLMW